MGLRADPRGFCHVKDTCISIRTNRGSSEALHVYLLTVVQFKSLRDWGFGRMRVRDCASWMMMMMMMIDDDDVRF